jgi:hypothetical protein
MFEKFGNEDKDIIAQFFFNFLTQFENLKNIFILHDALNIMKILEKQRHMYY